MQSHTESIDIRRRQDNNQPGRCWIKSVNRAIFHVTNSRARIAKKIVEQIFSYIVLDNAWMKELHMMHFFCFFFLFWIGNIDNWCSMRVLRGVYVLECICASPPPKYQNSSMCMWSLWLSAFARTAPPRIMAKAHARKWTKAQMSGKVLENFLWMDGSNEWRRYMWREYCVCQTKIKKNLESRMKHMKNTLHK